MKTLRSYNSYKNCQNHNSGKTWSTNHHDNYPTKYESYQTNDLRGVVFTMYNYIENVKVPQLLQNWWIKMTGIIWSTIHHAQSSYQIWKYRTNDLRGVNNKHQNWTKIGHTFVLLENSVRLSHIFSLFCAKDLFFLI
jgi:hypothetical protein